MKLLTKTNLNFLSISLFIFLIGIIAFYYMLRKQVDQNVNHELEKRKLSIIDQLESVHSTGRPPENLNEKIIINPIDKNQQITIGYSDTLIIVKSKNKYVPFRKLSFRAVINNQDYYVQVFKSLEETDMLIVRIFLIMTIVVIVIIITLYIMNRYTSLQAWKGFYDTIEKISVYNVNTHDEFSLNKADVKEFDELNNVLLLMTERIRNDYINLKEYTENASHEIQTPLAIINSKMELLLQSGNLSEKEYKAVADAFGASNRLSRLNKTLILLTKIENRQFPDSEKIIPGGIVNLQLENLDDLILNKSLKLDKDLDENLNIEMNPYLAEVLFLNLIKNAIRHNIDGGKINILLTNNSFQISNSGNELKFDQNKLFQRFYKSSDSPESTGLGLAIVQKICDLYNFKITYKYGDNLHIFNIEF